MRAVPLLALLALAACGSTESLEDEVGGPLPPLVPASLDSVDDMGVLGLADMPTSGTARFEGEMEASLGAPGAGGDRLTADLDMSVDFGDLSVSGTAGDFESAGLGALDGTAAIVGGVVGNDMSARMAGGLAGADPVSGESWAATLDLGLDGSFVAEDDHNGPQGVRGDVTGDVAVAGDGAIEVTDGSFVAVRTE